MKVILGTELCWGSFYKQLLFLQVAFEHGCRVENVFSNTENFIWFSKLSMNTSLL